MGIIQVRLRDGEIVQDHFHCIVTKEALEGVGNADVVENVNGKCVAGASISVRKKGYF